MNRGQAPPSWAMFRIALKMIVHSTPGSWLLLSWFTWWRDCEVDQHGQKELNHSCNFGYRKQRSLESTTDENFALQILCWKPVNLTPDHFSASGCKVSRIVYFSGVSSGLMKVLSFPPATHSSSSFSVNFWIIYYLQHECSISHLLPDNWSQLF